MGDPFKGLGLYQGNRESPWLPPGMVPPEGDVVVRNSTIDSLLLCGLRVGLADRPGYDPVPSEQMFFGTVVHDRIATVLAGGDPKHVFSPFEVDLAARLLANEEAFDLLAAVGDHHKAWIDEIVEALWIWHSDVKPRLSIHDKLVIEETRYRHLGTLPDGVSVWLRGTADVVDPTETLVSDWKTSGKGWDESKAHFTGQGDSYVWLYEDILGGLHVTWRFWVFNRKAQEWQLIESRRDATTVDSYLVRAWGAAKQVWADAYTAQPYQDTFGKYKRAWYCSPKYCGAWSICPAKALVDDRHDEPIDIEKGWRQ